MRRLLAGAAIGLALLLVGAPAHAQSAAAWEGSRETTEDRNTTGSFVITALFVRRYDSRVQTFSAETVYTVPAGLPAGCDAPGHKSLQPTHPSAGPEPDSTATTSAMATVACNGVYPFRVTARLSATLLIPPDSHAVSGEVEVVVPAANVPRVSAAVDGDAVVVSWSPLENPPPDFLGYRVERRVGGGAWEPIAAKLDRSKRTFDDGSAPADTEVSYRVRTRRSAPTSSGEVLSDGRSVSLDANGTPTTHPDGSTTTTPGGADGGTTGGTGDGGTGGTGDGGTGGAGGAGTGGATTVPRSGPQNRGRTGIGTRAPRLGTPSQANFPPLLTPDDGGFEEEINYGDRSLAGEEGEEGDELSSLFYEEDTGRGMAVPVATGFVLAAWAFHLRFLAKAARPTHAALAPGAPADLGPDPLYESFETFESSEPFDPVAPVAPVDPFGAPPSLSDRYDPYR